MQTKIMNLAYKMEIETRQLPHREKKCSYTLLSQLFTGHGSGLEIYVDMEKINQLIFLQQRIFLFCFVFFKHRFQIKRSPCHWTGTSKRRAWFSIPAHQGRSESSPSVSFKLHWVNKSRTQKGRGIPALLFQNWYLGLSWRYLRFSHEVTSDAWQATGISCPEARYSFCSSVSKINFLPLGRLETIVVS